MADLARSSQQVLNVITDLVSKTRDLEQIYQTSADLLMNMESVDMVMIYMVDEETNEAVLKAHRHVPDSYLQRASRIPRPKGITWRVIETNKPLNVRDAQTDETIGPAGKALGKHGVVGMPVTLVSGGNAKGCIWLWSNKEKLFNDQEVGLLSSIGNQIATAVAWAKMYEERRKVWKERFRIQ